MVYGIIPLTDEGIEALKKVGSGTCRKQEGLDVGVGREEADNLLGRIDALIGVTGLA